MTLKFWSAAVLAVVLAFPANAETLMARGWDVDSLSYALRSGITPSGDAFGGAMGEVVLYGTQYLSDEDLEAMATYLMDDHG